MSETSPPPVSTVVLSRSAQLTGATVRLTSHLADLCPDGPRLVAPTGRDHGGLGTDASRIASSPAVIHAGPVAAMHAPASGVPEGVRAGAAEASWMHKLGARR